MANAAFNKKRALFAGTLDAKKKWIGENYIKTSLNICTPHPEFSGDQIEGNEVGRARGTYGEEQSSVQGFGVET
jgi:hypothetical protein